MNNVRVVAFGFAVLTLSAACSFGVDLTGFFNGVAPTVDAGPDAALPDAPLSQIELTPLLTATAPGGAVQLAAVVTPAQPVTWSVESGANSGSVSADGLFTAPYAAGEFRISATTADGA
jgi:hypothetical protein